MFSAEMDISLITELRSSCHLYQVDIYDDI